MDYYIETIQQLQQTFQLTSEENKELSQKLLSFQITYDPESDIQLTNLQKTLLLQQQQLAQLKQEKIKNSRVQQLDGEEEYQILQLNDQIIEKEAELKKIEDFMYQIEFQIRNSNQEIIRIERHLKRKTKGAYINQKENRIIGKFDQKYQWTRQFIFVICQ